MKNRLFGIFGKSTLATLLAGAVLAFSSPVAALAQGRGGHVGGGGRSFAGSARGFSGGGRAVYGGGHYAYGRGYGGGYYRGGGYGGGVYLGFGAPYAYGYGYAPAPCGFHDQAGYWHPAPCSVGGLGY
jgi:hypothetical protein